MINSILRIATGKGKVVTDPKEAFMMMQKNLTRKRKGLPFIDYELGGELKVSMEAFFNKIRARHHEQKSND